MSLAPNDPSAMLFLRSPRSQHHPDDAVLPQDVEAAPQPQWSSSRISDDKTRTTMHNWAHSKNQSARSSYPHTDTLRPPRAARHGARHRRRSNSHRGRRSLHPVQRRARAGWQARPTSQPAFPICDRGAARSRTPTPASTRDPRGFADTPKGRRTHPHPHSQSTRLSSSKNPRNNRIAPDHQSQRSHEDKISQSRSTTTQTFRFAVSFPAHHLRLRRQNATYQPGAKRSAWSRSTSWSTAC